MFILIPGVLAADPGYIWVSPYPPGVSSSGTEVVTPFPLDNGQLYHITASDNPGNDGIWWPCNNPLVTADAQFYTTVVPFTNTVETDWIKPHYDGMDRSFLQIKDGNGPWQDINWGSIVILDPMHEYTIPYIGKGNALTFRIYDWYDLISGRTCPNTCHLLVYIYKEPSTQSPEFPSAFLPATMIIGFIGAVLYIKRTKEN